MKFWEGTGTKETPDRPKVGGSPSGWETPLSLLRRSLGVLQGVLVPASKFLPEAWVYVKRRQVRALGMRCVLCGAGFYSVVERGQVRGRVGLGLNFSAHTHILTTWRRVARVSTRVKRRKLNIQREFEDEGHSCL